MILPAVVTIAFGVVYLLELIRALKGKADIFSAPVFIGPMFFYFFTFNAFICYLGPGKTYLRELDFIIGQVIAGVSYLSFLYGWHRRVHRRRLPKPCLDRSALLTHGLTWMILGLGGWVIFVMRSGGFLAVYGSVHGSGADWLGNTAYLYQMILFTGPALIMLVTSVYDAQGRNSRVLRCATAFTLLLFVDALLQGDRGNTFRCVMPWLLVPSLVRRTRPSRKYVVLAGLTTALLMAAFVTYRGFLYIGADRSDIRNANITAVLFVDREDKDALGNEYLIHCAMTSYSLRTLKFGWGREFLYPFVHVVPRIVWQTKPYLSEFAPPVIPSETWDREYGWHPANGSACGGAADIFEQLFVWAFAFWCLVGMAMRRLYDDTIRVSISASMLGYVSLIICALWLVSQGWFTFLMSSCYYLVPVIMARLRPKVFPVGPTYSRCDQRSASLGRTRHACIWLRQQG